MNYVELLPFMDKEELKKVAFQVVDGELPGVKLEMLFPFLGRESLNEVVDKLIESKNTKPLNRALPFVGREKVKKIYQMAVNGDLPDVDPRHCIPFLDSEEIKNIFHELIKKASEEDVEDED